MNAYIILEPILKDILLVIQPLRDDRTIRHHIVNEFRNIVQSVESLRGAIVEPFGSFVSNLFTRWGDLDISIELPNGSYISFAGKKRKHNLLGDVLDALRRMGRCRKLQFIPNARVPILKFENHQNISCDVSIDNLKGLMKSKFLYWISGIDGRFRELVLLVKEWAKAHAINNPKAGTLNSYSLTLLVIFHFQTCVPAILPPLKEIYPGNIVDDLSGVRDVVERQIEETCAANIARFKSDCKIPANRSSLSVLFISFFAKFSDIALRASEQGLCPFAGKWEDIRTNMRWQPKTYTFFIEDPFEQPDNTARTVSSGQLTRISEAFKRTHSELVSANQNRNSIIATLVRPQISRFIGGTAPVRSPGTSGRGPPQARQQVRRAAYSTAQLRPQFQNMSRGTRSARPKAVSNQRPPQSGHGQPQMVWRPRSDR
ncbi:protein HESO1 [Malania oleifera]|uniref:protein HESO1 n=1 Tax=Malania oleifera TaxID=397392 RepID=UPI0025AE694E|nr:protein HESO1 [Malania oleifera]XP_057979928.1 protein HESO1 [Malania oleifera]XP_057979929.1 protein HESO1 [Malania oleifera]XP_057979930.1 protein HESO1 [Malania oleifera]XP_057979931.1 protein HESO1 [Malania oleifera]